MLAKYYLNAIKKNELIQCIMVFFIFNFFNLGVKFRYFLIKKSSPVVENISKLNLKHKKVNSSLTTEFIELKLENTKLKQKILRQEQKINNLQTYSYVVDNIDEKIATSIINIIKYNDPKNEIQSIYARYNIEDSNTINKTRIPKIGDLVINENGVVGKILNISEKYSVIEVQMISDSKFYIPVQIRSANTNKRIVGLISGETYNAKNNTIDVMFFDEQSSKELQSAVTENSIVESSNEGLLVPAGILVGSVLSYDVENKKAIISLHSRLSNIKYLATVRSLFHDISDEYIFNNKVQK